VAFWCQNDGALKLKRYIEITLFNGLLAKKKLNQKEAFYEVKKPNDGSESADSVVVGGLI
jgi:hypothetical protein